MPEAILQKSAEDERVFEGYRRWGYLAANLDPLGFLTPSCILNSSPPGGRRCGAKILLWDDWRGIRAH